jgi:dTDP-4-dehydrorhamnose reductase
MSYDSGPAKDGGETLDRILLIGGTGRLGRELVKVFSGCLSPTRRDLDITSFASVRQFMKGHRFSTVIHCAALTDVRQCEQDRELAWKVNVQGVENLVRACLEVGRDIYFVFISTACVFAGDRGDYSEEDVPFPKNFYSLTKLLGEFVVQHSGLKESLVIRTNFVARERWPHERAFVDRFGTYLFADDVARAIQTLLPKAMGGTVHVCGDTRMSMYDLALMTSPGIRPMTMDEYVGPPLTVDKSLRSVRVGPLKMRRNT